MFSFGFAEGHGLSADNESIWDLYKCIVVPIKGRARNNNHIFCMLEVRDWVAGRKTNRFPFFAFAGLNCPEGRARRPFLDPSLWLARSCPKPRRDGHGFLW